MIKEVLARYSGASLARLQPKRTTSAGTTPQSAEDAVISSLSAPQYSLAKLEKHLGDHNSGKGNLSEEGYGYTRQRTRETLDGFARLGFVGFDAVTRLLSAGLPYAKRVRAVEGLHQTAETAARMDSVAKELTARAKS